MPGDRKITIMKATHNFFDKKRSWSELKDEILISYLTPYLTKISHTRCPITIADCFAGKGMFDDGQLGSPLYIAQAIKDFNQQSASKVDVQGVFIEKKYFKELQENLCSFSECKLIDSDYENWATKFVKENRDQRRNLLLYVDPYGIKHLPFHHFKEICLLDLNSIEILLNFNSFGFLREGCRLLDLRDFECNDGSDVYEQDEANSVPRMNAIANGSYWQTILADYSSGTISMNEAERIFSEAYINEMKTLFRYVVNIPIKVKKSHLPKYRLVFGTNSEDGLLLVADKMSRTWKGFVERERKGQQLLFDEIDFPDANSIGLAKPEEVVWDLLSTPHDLKVLLVKLIEKYGICYSESKLKEYCKKMEKDGEIIVTRDPSRTPTGKVSSSWEYKKYKIVIKRGQSCQKSLL
jgi:three-Cys-motif partner protein